MWYNGGMKKPAEPVVLLFRSSLFELSADLMNGVYDYARAHAWHVQMIEHGPALADQWHRSVEHSDDVVRQSLEFWKPSGCLVELECGSVNYSTDMFAAVPTVYLDRSPKEDGGKSLCVYSDAASIVRCVAKELLAFGWRNAAFVPCAEPWRIWCREREQAFVSVMRGQGCDVHVFAPRSDGTNEQLFLSELEQWLRELPLPCALFAANDLIGRQVLAMVKKAGIDVPSRLAVVAVDNEPRICEHTVPTLSSVRQDLYSAGYRAAELLDERMRHPRKRLASRPFGAVEIVRRASSSRCGGNDVRVLTALEYIRLNACRGISSADVAAQFDCSRRFLDRTFGRSVGHSILHEIQKAQVEGVKVVLRKEKALKQDALAERCGFSSPEDMRRVFKKIEGVTIGKWLDASS